MEYWEIFSKRILEICKKREISVTELARMSKVPQSTLDNIVHGKSKNPKMGTLHRVANVLGLTVSEFLDFPELNAYEFEDPEDEQDDNT